MDHRMFRHVVAARRAGAAGDTRGIGRSDRSRAQIDVSQFHGLNSVAWPAERRYAAETKPSDDLKEVDGLAVMAPARLMIELAAVVSWRGSEPSAPIVKIATA